MSVPLSRVCALIACILFILAAFGVGFSSVAVVPLGLAFLAAALLL